LHLIVSHILLLLFGIVYDILLLPFGIISDILLLPFGIVSDILLLPFRYASLFFVAGINTEDNELITLEIVHRYVEILDRYFGNVCELDLIFNFHKAYFIMDELLIAGEIQETSKKSVLRVITQQDQYEETEASEQAKGNSSWTGDGK